MSKDEREDPMAAWSRLAQQNASQIGALWGQWAKAGAELSVAGARAAVDASLQALEQAPDQPLAGVQRTALEEYQRDLERLSPDALSADYGRLLSAWSEVAQGHGSPEQALALRQFMEGLKVKSRLGPEYYADPASIPVGQTPRAEVWSCDIGRGTLRLFHYRRPEGVEPAAAPPLLIVYSVINQPWILDLVAGFSFIEHLVGRGLEVYLIEWPKAEPFDRQQTLDALIERGIDGAVDHISAAHQGAPVSLLGHCIGGNFAALYAGLHPQKVERLLLLTVPGTAAAGGVVALWTRPETLPVDRIVDAAGVMPAKLIRYTFMALKPYGEIQKWKMWVDLLGNEAALQRFYAIDRWANDNVDVAPEVFRRFIREVFLEDRFRHGQCRIEGRTAELARYTGPVLNVAARGDWIVSPESAQVFEQAFPEADYRYHELPGSHVSMLVDERQRAQWDVLADFLLDRA